MAVRKIKNSWWVDFAFAYTRYRKRSPVNSRAGALDYEIFLRQKLARGESLETSMGSQQDHTFEQFASKWFEDYVQTNNKYSEQRTKKYVLSASLVPFFGTMPIRNITAHTIERYKAQEMTKG